MPLIKSPIFNNQRGGFLIIISITILLILAGLVIAYFALNTVNKKAQIKTEIDNINVAFDAYSQSVKELGEEMLDEGTGSDVDSLERSLQKGKTALKSVEDNLSILSPMVDKLSSPETAEYKANLKSYIDKSTQLSVLSKDDLGLFEKLMPHLREMTRIGVDLSGIANYMYSDPDKYVKEVTAAIDQQEKVLTEIGKIQTNGDAKESLDNLIKVTRYSIDYVRELSLVVGKRDQDGIAALEKKDAKVQEELDKESNRIRDSQKEKRKELIRELESLKDKIKNQYSELKATYK